MSQRNTSKPLAKRATKTNGSSGPRRSPRAKLDNGLEVVVIPDHRAPVVTHMVWYRNGSADDPAGKSGIAHFLEHLMFKGTQTSAGRILGIVAELGGQENAFTSNDYTAYFQRVAKEHLRGLHGIRSRPDEEPRPDRRGRRPPNATWCSKSAACGPIPIPPTLNEAVQATLFPHHPYGTPVIGWGHEIESSAARTRSPITSASTRRKTRSSSSPAMSSRKRSARSPAKSTARSPPAARPPERSGAGAGAARPSSRDARR